MLKGTFYSDVSMDYQYCFSFYWVPFLVAMNFSCVSIELAAMLGLQLYNAEDFLVIVLCYKENQLTIGRVGVLTEMQSFSLANFSGIN